MLECDNEQQWHWQQITLIRMSPPSSDFFRLILETASQVWNWTFTRHRFISNFGPILVNLETVKICLIWSYTSLMHFCKSTLEIDVNLGPTQIHQIHNKLQNKLRLPSQPNSITDIIRKRRVAVQQKISLLWPNTIFLFYWSSFGHNFILWTTFFSQAGISSSNRAFLFRPGDPLPKILLYRHQGW